MNVIPRFGMAGTSVVATALIATGLLAPLPAVSETVMTINGKAMDSEVLDVYILQRSQKPLDQVSAEDKAVLTDELADLYVLSTIDIADEVAAEPDIQAQLELQRMATISQIVATRLSATIDVSEEEIQKVYEEQVKLAPRQEFRASHILVQTQGEALEIIQLLISGGNFEELAGERSLDSSKSSGGDVGWFLPTQMVRPVAEAVYRLQDGRYTTDPIQSEYGWHVIKRTGARDANPPPLEGVRDQITTALQQSKLREKIDEIKAQSVE
jgi:peptidyl-prolyl cis-trans isomerase C